MRREDGHVLRMALYFQAEENMEEAGEEESVEVCLRRDDALYRSKGSVSVYQNAT